MCNWVNEALSKKHFECSLTIERLETSKLPYIWIATLKLTVKGKRRPSVVHGMCGRLGNKGCSVLILQSSAS